jgi:hypothetical protein
MKELFKEYIQQVNNRKVILGGDAFFAFYDVTSDGYTVVDKVFIGEKYSKRDIVLKIISSIDSTLEGFGFTLDKIVFQLNTYDPNFLVIIEALLTLSFDKHSYVTTDTILLLRSV